MKQQLPFLSICIPSYNRPFQLSNLLKSIDPSVFDVIEVVICEDNSPTRAQIVDVVDKYSASNRIQCKLFLNEINLHCFRSHFDNFYIKAQIVLKYLIKLFFILCNEKDQ